MTSTISGRVSVPNPCSSIDSVYDPGGSATSRYVPVASVTSDRVSPVPWFLAVAVAPGMTAALESLKQELFSEAPIYDDLETLQLGDSLGMYAEIKGMRDHLVQKVLADVDPIALDFFWRGAGRAFYFSPLHMLQSVFSPWIAAEMEAPNEKAFKGLKAGITWATNVVNMRQPEIFEDLIKRRGAAEESEGTIRHGVAASTTMAIDITPNHPVVKAYLDYRPKSSDPKVQALWEKLVHEPAYRAVTRYQPILKRHRMLDQVFRFQDLDALVDRLEASEVSAQTA